MSKALSHVFLITKVRLQVKYTREQKLSLRLHRCLAIKPEITEIARNYYFTNLKVDSFESLFFKSNIVLLLII